VTQSLNLEIFELRNVVVVARRGNGDGVRRRGSGDGVFLQFLSQEL